MESSDFDVWRLFDFRRLELDTLPTPIRNTLAECEEYMEKVRKRDLSEFHLPNLEENRPLPISQFGFVDEWRLNAYVDGKSDESLVVFTAALPFALRDQFDYLLYDARLLNRQPYHDPTLGLANKIRPPPVDYTFLRTNRQASFLHRLLVRFGFAGTLDSGTGRTSGGSSDRMNLAYQFPTHALQGDFRTREQRVGVGQLPAFHDPKAHLLAGTRQSLAYDLTNIAFKFLLDHETAHVIKGHLGYRIRYLRQSRFAEMASYEKAADDPDVLQAMEMDADTYAASQALLLVAPSSSPYAVVQKIVPLYQRVHRAAFAIGVLLMLLEKRRRPLARCIDGSHPPHRLRLMNFVAAARIVARDWLDPDRLELDQGLHAAHTDLELASRIMRSDVLFTDEADIDAVPYLMRLRQTITDRSDEWVKCAPNIQGVADKLLRRRLTRSLIQLAPQESRNRADLLNQRAVLAQARGEYAEAIVDFRLAADMDGLGQEDAMRIRCNLAAALIASGERQHALIELERIIGAHATEARIPALTLRGELHAREGNRPEALADWESALKPSGGVIYPQELARVQFVRAKFLAAWGETTRAIEDFVAVTDTAGVRRTHFVDACYELTVIHSRAGDFRRVVEYAGKFLKHEGETKRSLSMLIFRALAAAQLGLGALALKDLEIVLNSDILDEDLRSLAKGLRENLSPMAQHPDNDGT